MNSDNIEILSHIEHVLKRPTIYVGDVITQQKRDWFIKNCVIVFESFFYNEAFFKLIYEVMDNSVDEYTKTDGKFGDALSIKIKKVNDDYLVSIHDNGRGLSTEIKNGKPQAYYAFCNLMAGSNFDDSQRRTKGMYGLGVTLTNIYSSYFRVRTINQKEKFLLECTDNMSEINFELLKPKKTDIRGTKVSFTLESGRFVDLDKLDLETILGVIQLRLIEIKTFNPNMTLYLNGAEIEHGITSYLKNDIYYKNDVIFSLNLKKNDLDVSQDMSYINGIYTYDGGTHLDFITNHAYQYLSELINKSFKIDIKYFNLKKYFFVFLSLMNVNAPNLIGQNKTKYKGDVKVYLNSHLENINVYLKNYFNNNIEYFKSITANLNTIAEDKEIARLKKEQKKVNVNLFENFYRIEKHIKGEGELFIAEGDSAISTSLEVRDSRKHAFYALGGKILNVYDVREIDIRKSEKIANLLIILGIDLKDPDYLKNLNYRYINILTDSDSDGGHIFILLSILFCKYFPEIINTGRLRKIVAPIVTIHDKKGNLIKTYYDHKQFKNDREKYSDKVIHYYKGLGAYSPEQYKELIFNPKIQTISYNTDDATLMSKIFTDDTAFKKEWLS